MEGVGRGRDGRRVRRTGMEEVREEQGCRRVEGGWMERGKLLDGEERRKMEGGREEEGWKTREKREKSRYGRSEE